MENKKVALITGITGQIGSYLAELLVEKGYDVYGIMRKKFNEPKQLEVLNEYKIFEGDLELLKKYKIFEGDLDDPHSIERAIMKAQPDEIYNLAAQSDAQASFYLPEYTLKVNGLIVSRICESAIKLNKKVKVFQASSAELYGGMHEGLVDENTEFYPKNPYAIGKLCAYWIIRYYREKSGLFANNGILFNTESPRRGENFVTKKIIKSVAEISKGKQDKLTLGNLNAKRDWSHAKDTALGIWMIMQAEKPSDYVIASGETHSIREFVELAFKHVGIEIAWKGEGVDEVGYDKNTEKVYVTVDPLYFRPDEKNNAMAGNISKIKAHTGWQPRYSIKDIVSNMIKHEIGTS